MAYFLIISTEDGARIEEVAEQELLARLNADEDEEPELAVDRFLKSIPNPNPNYWPGNVEQYLLIRGEIVQPQVTHRVVRETVELP